MKNALAIVGLLAIAGFTLAAGFQTDDFAPNQPVPVPGPVGPVTPVEVVNVPLPVEGTVNVAGPVTVDGAVAVSGEVTVGNLPAVQTVTGTVEIANLGGCQSPEPLVVTLFDNVFVAAREEFVSGAIDLTSYVGGQIALQLVIESSSGQAGANVYPQWTLVDGQLIPSEGLPLQTTALSSDDGAANLMLASVDGRFLRVRLWNLDNDDSIVASVHVLAFAD